MNEGEETIRERVRERESERAKERASERESARARERESEREREGARERGRKEEREIERERVWRSATDETPELEDTLHHQRGVASRFTDMLPTHAHHTAMTGVPYVPSLCPDFHRFSLGCCASFLNLVSLACAPRLPPLHALPRPPPLLSHSLTEVTAFLSLL